MTFGTDGLIVQPITETYITSRRADKMRRACSFLLNVSSMVLTWEGFDKTRERRGLELVRVTNDLEGCHRVPGLAVTL